ncbi:MAG TPA: hypothetical protein VFF06_08880 [Polyangia bacterium]|nr:hypothetical protein [Polyangia bacterium]
MSKSAVYSWRVAPEVLGALEAEARRDGASVAELIDRIAGQWLAERRAERAGEDAEQARLRAAALRAAGTIAGGDPHRSKRAKSAIRERLRERRAR